VTLIFDKHFTPHPQSHWFISFCYVEDAVSGFEYREDATRRSCGDVDLVTPSRSRQTRLQLHFSYAQSITVFVTSVALNLCSVVLGNSVGFSHIHSIVDDELMNQK